MKRITVLRCLVLTLVILMSGANTFAQGDNPSGQPLLQEGKVWNYDFSYVDINFNRIQGSCTYWIEGDTIVDGKKLFWMYNTDTEKNDVFKQLWYEETGKVYVCNETGVPERIVYDFSLSQGDIISESNSSWWTDSGFEVLSTDTIFVRGNYRKRLHIKCQYNEDVKWVEGIGNVGRLDEPIFHMVSDGREYAFVSCYEGDECVFDGNDYNAPKYEGNAAPDYYPQGTVWEEESHFYYPTTDTFNSTYLRNTVVGDTVINDISYRKVVAEKRVGDNSDDASWDRVSPWHWEPYDTFGIRQEGNKVYYFRYEPVIGEKEFMRYDFDWSVGMEIPLKLNAIRNKDYTLAKIDQVVNVVLGDGQSYEGVTVENDNEEVAQMKGIGSIGNYGGLFSYYAWNTVPWDGSTMYYHRVLNFTRNGVCLYEWDRDSFVASQMELLGVNAVHDLDSHGNGSIYTLDGRNVTGIPLHSLQKGIYIQNDRKVVVR